MKLDIRHDTVYRYQSPVRYSIQYLRLTPRADAGQRILDWRLDTPGRRWRQVDAFGNIVHVISLDSAHDELRITARGSVETFLSPGATIYEESSLPVEAFLVPTRLTQPDAAVLELARNALGGAAEQEQGLRRLMDEIHGRVRYETGSTDVDHTATEALAQGSGVCQDHAHIFISCVRAAGIPGRYVSGYIDAGDASHVSSHAWADVWMTGRGWVSFDTTHRALAGESYCRLAVGRDFLDASPVRGMRQGGSGERLTVQVAVEVVPSTLEQQ